jgi:hypothetical protein
MKSARLEVRLEPELLARLPVGGRARSRFVRGALEAALLSRDGGIEGEGRCSSLSPGRAMAASLRASDVSSVFKCPSWGCDFRAASGKARCGAHGRQVVPVDA